MTLRAVRCAVPKEGRVEDDRLGIPARRDGELIRLVYPIAVLAAKRPA